MFFFQDRSTQPLNPVIYAFSSELSCELQGLLVLGLVHVKLPSLADGRKHYLCDPLMKGIGLRGVTPEEHL